METNEYIRLKNTRAAAEKLHSEGVYAKGYRSAENVSFLLFVLGLLVAVLALRAFVAEPVRVEGESMQNTLQDTERCLVEKVSYEIGAPKPGDIVIVHFPGRGKTTFVKRVIATAGQTVSLGSELVTDPETNSVSVRHFVLVDGEKLDESAYEDDLLFDPGYQVIPITCDGSENGSYTVPEGCIFVMGDHRTNSTDSRTVGAIPLYDVVGRVRGVIYPFRSARLVG